jgi:cyclophilin family peptidyl-prolyl cis-trans isomerase
MTSGTATVTMTTNFGNIVVKVDSSLGPNAAGAFVALARCGYYDNVLFHRVVVKFIIQTGDGQYGRLPSFAPDRMGQGGPGWNIPDDKVTTTYKRGTVAIARTSAANSGNSQFFIVLDDSAQASLGATTTNNYAIFGSVTSGMDVADRIAAGRRARAQRRAAVDAAAAGGDHQHGRRHAVAAETGAQAFCAVPSSAGRVRSPVIRGTLLRARADRTRRNG